MRSFHYAAAMSMLSLRPEDQPRAEPWGWVWQAWAAAAFLRGYLDTAKGSVLVPSGPMLEVLLDAAVIEKAFVELRSELQRRPEMAWIPMQGILRMSADSHATPRRARPKRRACPASTPRARDRAFTTTTTIPRRQAGRAQRPCALAARRFDDQRERRGRAPQRDGCRRRSTIASSISASTRRAAPPRSARSDPTSASSPRRIEQEREAWRARPTTSRRRDGVKGFAAAMGKEYGRPAREAQHASRAGYKRRCRSRDELAQDRDNVGRRPGAAHRCRRAS